MLCTHSITRYTRVFFSRPSGSARRYSETSSKRRTSRSTCRKNTQASSTSSSRTSTKKSMCRPSLYRPFWFQIRIREKGESRETIHPTQIRTRMHSVGAAIVVRSHDGAVTAVVDAKRGILNAFNRNIRVCTGRTATAHNVQTPMGHLAGLVRHHASLPLSRRQHPSHSSTDLTGHVGTTEGAGQTVDLWPHDLGHHQP